MDKEAKRIKEIKNFEEKLKDREDAIPAHSTLKRFLDWIARGTEKSRTGKPLCPT